MKKLLVFCFLITALSAQTITVTPSEPYVGVGSTQQFYAAVTGLSNSTVTWSLIGSGPTNNPVLGTISASGLYTAPSAVPGQNPVTVRATGSDGKTVGIAYVLIEGLGPTLTSISPDPVIVGSYTVTVKGKGFVKGAYVNAGGISLQVTYVSSTELTAMGYQGTAGNVAFSVGNPGTVYSNIVNVPFVTPITVSPSTATVALGASKTFTASAPATWTASAGTITGSGIYTAPATMPSSSTVTITATGSAGQTGTAKVTLSQPETPVTAPTFSPPAGTYTAAQTITIASTTTGASIRYTTDGTTPSATAGTLYSTGFSVGATATVDERAKRAATASREVNGTATGALSAGRLWLSIKACAAASAGPALGASAIVLKTRS